ncbi:C-C motif chemokine 20 isoform X1 [Apteryx rowi]|uniref:C-C motif chemokine 20 isoform X1 n=1 Tax=Apteryx rowi TaxID=308060 RepID=UPI000E1D95E2|nr:C-C motif chemokine 20 isoform X1 [Apteryx rowi]
MRCVGPTVSEEQRGIGAAGLAGASERPGAQWQRAVRMAGFNCKSLVLASLLGLLVLLLSGPSQAQSNQDCCLSYSKGRLPRWAIKGYTEQLSSEVCDISAIIFHTQSGLNACVNPKEAWVKRHLLWLSQKLKRMSM